MSHFHVLEHGYFAFKGGCSVDRCGSSRLAAQREDNR